MSKMDGTDLAAASSGWDPHDELMGDQTSRVLHSVHTMCPPVWTAQLPPYSSFRGETGLQEALLPKLHSVILLSTLAV